MTALQFHLVGWFLVLVVAMVNGIARGMLYNNLLGETVAKAVSTFVLLALVAGVCAALHVWKPLGSYRAAWTVGIAWCLATVAFEALLGRYASQMSWQAVGQMYDPRTGALWALIPLATLGFPPLFRWLGSFDALR